MYLSVDPGINNTGLTIFESDVYFSILYSYNINNLRKLTEEEKKVETRYDLRVVKILHILSIIEKLLDNYEIEACIVEAPFYNALTPVAFGSLLEVISSIKYNLIIPRNISFQLLEPLLIKKMFTKERLANKNLMKQLLHEKIAKKEIIVSNTIDIDLLTEHQIDSIAIGYCWHLLRERK